MSAPRPDPNRPEKPLKIQAGGVKKARNEGTKVVTANDLFSGGVVYWTADGSWTDDLSAAFLLEGETALEEVSKAAQDEGRAVGPYLMDVTEALLPSGRGRLREEIREAGPTIHPQFARRNRRA